MPFEDTKILEFNLHRQSVKAPFIIYTDLESLIVNIVGCKNNMEKSSTTKLSEYIPSVFSMSPIWSFKDIENKDDISRDKDYMKRFC